MKFRHALMLLCLLAACGDESPAPAMQAQGTQNLTCTPSAPRQCPCLYGGMGMQVCLPAGNGYGECQGCSARPQGPAMPVDNPQVQMPGPNDPMPMPMMPDAGMPMPDAGMETPDTGMGSADEPMVMAGMEGTSCGVGLPALCALETEKCCVRSLETDTCIPAGESCDCGVRGCETLEAYCDGEEDCPDGQVCCGTLGGSTYSEFRCAANCDYRGSQRIACHQGETECPGGNICANSQLLTNLQVCIDESTIQQ